MSETSNSVPLGQEQIPADEAAFSDQLRTLHLKVHQVQPGAKFRGEHPKQHAGLWATFSVETQLPQELRAGIFSEPRNYKALVRFSNGRSPDDRNPDVRGMAIKVLVPQADNLPFQQDFITANHPVFFARNVKHLFEFLAATASGTPPAQLAVTTHPKLAGFAKPAKSSLLAMQYWSQTPYRLGKGAVKYLVVPEGTPSEIELGSSPDFLREALAEQLNDRKQGARFAFCVQRQMDATAMPIEDPTVEWTSEPVRLATLTIEPQMFNTATRADFFERLSWSPWNALPDHAPLGGINRVRRMVYQESSDLRQTANKTSIPVVTGQETF